jgi:anti-sigma regulatory factor (Ser/Thr protein kinase)
VREALSNAYRHGSATAVGIVATEERGGAATLDVVDNGYGPRDGDPGLGSVLLDQWTESDWTLESTTGGGARLVAHLKISGSS